jgi:hypothetical protein
VPSFDPPGVEDWGTVMKKLLQLVVAGAVAAGSLLVASSSAWALPCTSGERVVGKTDSAWLCLNLDTGVVREQPF